MTALAFNAARGRIRTGLLMLLLALVAGGTFFAARAMATVVGTCWVNASGGYIHCISKAGTEWQQVKALHATGVPYYQALYRASDGAIWGPWYWNDMAYHTIPLGTSTTITLMVDNLGTGNPSAYHVAMG